MQDCCKPPPIPLPHPLYTPGPSLPCGAAVMHSWSGLLHVHTSNTFSLLFSLSSTAVVSAGIQKSRVEDMEERLKADVLREAALYGNQIMVAHENDDFQVAHRLLLRLWA